VDNNIHLLVYPHLPFRPRCITCMPSVSMWMHNSSRYMNMHMIEHMHGIDDERGMEPMTSGCHDCILTTTVVTNSCIVMVKSEHISNVSVR
jgi:hypothetical protein